MFDPLYAVSKVSQGVVPGWLAISIDMSGEQFGKNKKWHNITICTSIDFAPEASMLIWSYFSRHGDSHPSFGKCINVDCSDVDVFWVTRGWLGHVDRGTIVAEWAFWTTGGHTALGLAWSSLGFWPSWEE